MTERRLVLTILPDNKTDQVENSPIYSSEITQSTINKSSMNQNSNSLDSNNYTQLKKIHIEQPINAIEIVTPMNIEVPRENPVDRVDSGNTSKKSPELKLYTIKMEQKTNIESKMQSNRERQRKHVEKYKPYKDLALIKNPDERIVELMFLSYPEFQHLPKYVLLQEVDQFIRIMKSKYFAKK